MMYPLYPGAQEATATSGQPHQWNTGGQLPPMVFPSLNPLSIVASTASALEQHTNTAVAGSVSNILASAGCPPVPPLPSNPAPPKPPAPPTEEKPPLPPDPPPPDEDSKVG
uniref:Uncharacterized protein n=1 Tax=Octopus bimaculoides TaxID=37653 RepID=A0A0L8HS45_OCTBM